MRGFVICRTVKLLENPLDSAGASAAAHGHIELVCVGRHVWERVLRRVECVDSGSLGGLRKELQVSNFIMQVRSTSRTPHRKI